jgi:predicted SprT family Zn-dependent metalloprotease
VAAGLLASAAMNGAVARALRPTDAARVDAILRRLGALWRAPALSDTPAVLNSRLSRTLGRLVGRPRRIELGPRTLLSSDTLREVVTHEGAHAVLAKSGDSAPRQPHGPEWRELMSLAGYPQATGAHWRCHSPAGVRPKQKQQAKPKTQAAITYDHWCPVCQSSRIGRRPVKAWRCAACVAAGLDGRLEITRRSRRPTTSR